MLKRTTTTEVLAARQGRGGFTLMEMLVVVAIIVIIAGAATPLVLNYLAQARVDRAKMDIKSIEKAVVSYQLQHGQYPQSLQELTVPDPVYQTPPKLDLKSITDPWGRPYNYNPGQFTTRGVPTISSGGPNGNGDAVINNNND